MTILYVKDLSNSLSKSQTVLNTYGNIPGYKVYLEKSEIIPLTNIDHSELQQTKWPTDGLDSNLNNLYEVSYHPLLSKIEEDSRQWVSLPLTLIGRVKCIKMNVQPRLQ